MIISLLLELAVGDIRRGEVWTPTSLTHVLEYHRASPSINSLIDVMDALVDIGELDRHRIIKIPFGFNLKDTYSHLYSVSASAYREDIPVTSIVVDEWFRNNISPLRVGTVVSELRKILLTHILRDNVHELIDEYIVIYYTILIDGLIEASR